MLTIIGLAFVFYMHVTLSDSIDARTPKEKLRYLAIFLTWIVVYSVLIYKNILFALFLLIPVMILFHIPIRPRKMGLVKDVYDSSIISGIAIFCVSTDYILFWEDLKQRIKIWGFEDQWLNFARHITSA